MNKLTVRPGQFFRLDRFKIQVFWMGSSASKVKVLQKTVEEMKDKIKEMEREACTKHDAFQKIESEKSKLLCKVTVLEELVKKVFDVLYIIYHDDFRLLQLS